jgi:ribosomal protein S18 acetylase RimI-like enzyme
MNLVYFKRYRMEIDLGDCDMSLATPPPPYRFVAWDDSLLDAVAEAKYLSFHGEIDTNVFPGLGERDGCRRLMRDISRKPGFLPAATWLAVRPQADGEMPEYCGTVQGIRDKTGMGSIQNLGITPEHRGRGLGSSLLFSALKGFRDSGLKRVFLEVTSHNDGAIRLYRRLGFSTVKTVFKAAEASAPHSRKDCK